ncbi:S-ribosylhomocysteine lyase [Beduinella massiliensis]|uniref:S-ribosylhomocysteine lyase n=1 Tax=Beduinella massiliensis TaxID=1852363 RepID=UPI000C83278F
METIASFQIDHDILTPGMYVSRVDGDVVTYDLRFKRPNQGDYVSNGALHTFEHLFATYVRNSRFGDQVVYFGPMGCRTGFYFLTREGLSRENAIALTREACDFIARFEGEIPGARPRECGNYREHDLEDARREAAAYARVLEGWTPERMAYPA